LLAECCEIAPTFEWNASESTDVSRRAQEQAFCASCFVALALSLDDACVVRIVVARSVLRSGQRSMPHAQTGFSL
jgi:hypothetical protein